MRLRRALTAGALLAVVSGLVGAAGFDIDRPMDEAAARAMLNRLGYGATPGSLVLAREQTPRQYLKRAVVGDTRLPPSVAERIAGLPMAEPLDKIWERLGPGGGARKSANDEEAKKEIRQEENRFASATVQARLLTMANSDNPGHEALLSFWLNHFSIFAPKNLDKLLAADYIRSLDSALRQDSFEALLRAAFYHPAMQVYLDNARSTATTSLAAMRAAKRGKQLGINENLARELLELHTLGVDAGYTQKDVQELARIITGAGIYAPDMRDAMLARAGASRQGLFLFDPRRHDFTEKFFLGQSFPAGQGIAEVDRALHLLAVHPSTAQKIALELARRFLDDEPPAQVVAAMAAGFRHSGGKISATLTPLLESPAFAASLSAPTKFKEPVDYVLSVARAACGDTPINNGRILAATVLDMGEAPLMHTTPDGYPGREADWLSPAAMAKRVRLAMAVAGERLPLAQDDSDRLAGLAALNGDARHFLRGEPCPIDMAVLDKAVGPVAPQAGSPRLAAAERAAILLASPEFMRR